MPEIETLFVRIEADLTAFKRGIAEAKRETLGFANEARGTFAGVGLAGAGLGGLDRDLADAGRRVEDLSTGFVELTQAAGDFETQGGALAELVGRTNVLFGEQSGLLGELGAQVPELGDAFTTLLERTSQEAETLNDAVGVLGQSFLDAFEGAIQRGESLSDVLKGLALDLARLAAQRGGDALFGGLLGGLFGGGGPGPLPDPAGFAESIIPFARGNAFSSGIGELIAATQGTAAAQRFARGGVLTSPTLFRFARGVGLAGEAGPEAILPLARMSDGKLGVLAGPPPLSQAGPPPLPDMGGAGVTVVNYEFNINAPGADREGLREVMALIQVVRREGQETRRMMPAVALRTVLDSRRRGGSIARAFGAR